ncbi:hypothetical protein [Nonomuraea dietziae]|uniref:hypothetical protein n=1 Tax=Nonomuraea dietziae TaxID=65515 RepID=UPI0031E1237F
MTARRYLSTWWTRRSADRVPQYGGVGRPELLYRIRTQRNREFSSDPRPVGWCD